MFDFNKVYIAKDIDDAITELSQNSKSILMAGGTDVLVKIRHGELKHANIISIADIKELKSVCFDEKDNIVIGAGTCFTNITSNEIIKKYIPALGVAVDDIGGPQVRNVATIGGNLCNAAVSADSAGILLVLDAAVELVSKSRKRIVKLDGFFTGPSKTVKNQDEMMTKIIIKKENYENHYSHYIKFSQRKAMDISILNCAVNLKLNDDKTKIDEYKIAFGVAAPKPMLCKKTQVDVIGRPLNKETLDFISNNVLKEISPRDSWRGSKSFRLQLAKELSIRTTKQALLRAGGKLDA